MLVDESQKGWGGTITSHLSDGVIIGQSIAISYNN